MIDALKKLLGRYTLADKTKEYDAILKAEQENISTLDILAEEYTTRQAAFDERNKFDVGEKLSIENRYFDFMKGYIEDIKKERKNYDNISKRKETVLKDPELIKSIYLGKLYTTIEKIQNSALEKAHKGALITSLLTETIKKSKSGFYKDNLSNKKDGVAGMSYGVKNIKAKKDKIVGGLADKKSPKEIAQDHIWEDKDYYNKLKKIEKAFKMGLISEDVYDKVKKKVEGDIEKSNKYIRREGAKGNYKYTYAESKETDKKVDINKIENDIVKLDYEHGYCLDSEHKEIFNHTEKKEESITLPDNLLEQMEGCIYTHNHPSYKKHKGTDLGEYGFNLSPQDIYFACANKLKEIRAVSGNYSYSISKTDNENFTLEDLEPIRLEIKNQKIKVDTYLLQLYKTGKYDNSQLNVMSWNLIYENIAKKMNLQYKREKL